MAPQVTLAGEFRQLLNHTHIVGGGGPHSPVEWRFSRGLDSSLFLILTRYTRTRQIEDEADTNRDAYKTRLVP
jgi:hypothetical protein